MQQQQRQQRCSHSVCFFGYQKWIHVFVQICVDLLMNGSSLCTCAQLTYAKMYSYQHTMLAGDVNKHCWLCPQCKGDPMWLLCIMHIVVCVCVSACSGGQVRTWCVSVRRLLNVRQACR